METKNVVIDDKVLPNKLRKKRIEEKEKKQKERQQKEIDGTLRMAVCHPEYSNSELFTLQCMDEDNSTYFNRHTFRTRSFAALT